MKVKKNILYIGLNDKDSKVQEINTLDAYKIVMNLVQAAGYEGASITESQGFYTHEDGSFTIEKSLQVSILFAESEKTERLIESVKKSLNQESVALEDFEIESSLK